MADKFIPQTNSLLSSSFPVLLPKLEDVSIPLDIEQSRLATSNAITRPSNQNEHDASIVQHNATTSPFMHALLSQQSHGLQSGQTLTANGDVTLDKTGSALVDLFVELEGNLLVQNLRKLLSAAWSQDAEATLRLIWNARSIHLGKSSRHGFYRAMAWVASVRPRTFLYNLPWLVRPVIKRAERKSREKVQQDKTGNDDKVNDHMELDNDDFEMVDAEAAKTQPGPINGVHVKDDRAVVQFDVKYGHAHGYWKDLLNLLVLAVHDELHEGGKISETLYRPKTVGRERDWTPGLKKTRLTEQHERVTTRLVDDRFYREFHYTVARLFADQLRVDLARLKCGNTAKLKHISMAAKWAPSNKGSHDCQTFIVSTIAEFLYPIGETTGDSDRTTKLKHARIAYQSQTLSPLRKHLDLTERKLSEKAYDKIDYSHVPSLAMQQYSKLFKKNDLKHFEEYITNVAEGRATVSGAVLLPSVLIAAARRPQPFLARTDYSFSAKRQEIEHRITRQLLDGQWKTLVQRIKDSGKLESSIAVCDVSGSMTSTMFSDRTTPMDSAIGLSLLLAEVVAPPFGGAFITFSSFPAVVQVGGEHDTRSLSEKCDAMVRSTWGMNTNLVAVFRDLILPMAKKHKLKPEDMVKRVFVFSDMQFDQASYRNERWSSSFERLKQTFAVAGYDMPELIFWDLASNAMSRSGARPKAVGATEPGTVLVSGYSQAMLKMFLEGSSFDVEEDAVLVDRDPGTGEIVELQPGRQRMNSLKMVQKAIGHEAYRMLRVID